MHASIHRPREYRPAYLARNGIDKNDPRRESIAKPNGTQQANVNSRVQKNTIKYVGSRRFQPPIEPKILYRVRIQNISPDMLLSDLTHCFKKFPGVHQVWMDIDEKMQPNGTGGISFTNQTSAQHAICTYNGKIIQAGGHAGLDTSEESESSGSETIAQIISKSQRFKTGTLKPKYVRKVLTLRFAADAVPADKSVVHTFT